MERRVPEIIPTPERKVLLIGGNGNVGFGLQRSLTATYGPDTFVNASRSSATYPMDIRDRNSIARVIDEVEPSVVAYLAAATNVNWCEQNPNEAWEVNVIGTQNLVDVLEDAGGIPILLVSTDFVEAGEDEFHQTEIDTPHPQSVYGSTKRQAEIEVLESGLPSLIARISFPWYSMETHRHNPQLRDTMKWIVTELFAGNDVPAFKNVIGNWTSVEALAADISKLLNLVMDDDIDILHIGSPSHTVIEVAEEIYAYLQRIDCQPKGVIQPRVFVPEPGVTAPRPAKGGLDVSESHRREFAKYDVLGEIQDQRWLSRQEALRLMAASQR